MSIYTYLKKDHEEIKSLMDRVKLLGEEEPAERNSLFNQLKQLIVVHSKAEEKAFYDPLKYHSKTEEEVEHGESIAKRPHGYYLYT